MVTKIKRRGTLLLGSMKTKTNIATVFLGLIVVLLFSSTCSLASKNNNLRKELTETKKKHNKVASDQTKLYQISTDLNREYQVIDYKYKKDKETYEKVNSQVKFVVVGDLHDNTFKDDNKELLRQIKTQNPDFIIADGDILNDDSPNSDIAMSFIKRLVKIAPVYYALGNHEFEYMENQHSEEHVNVVENMKNKTYSIEHIMPQTLSDDWKKDLGPDYQNIHE